MGLSKKKSDELRRKAEQMLSKTPAEIEELDPAEIKNLFHELDVHRIELELQNEELQRAQSESRRSRDRYSQLYNRAPVGYLVLDDAGIIRRVNETFSHMQGSRPESLRNRAFADLLDDRDTVAFRSRYRVVFRQPRGKHMQVRVKREGEGAGFFPALVSLQSFQWKEGAEEPEEPGLLLTINDITDLKKLQKEKEDLIENLEYQRWAIGERAKELECLYAVNREIHRDIGEEELCRRIITHLESATQHPALTAPVIEIEDRIYHSSRYSPRLHHHLSAKIPVGQRSLGRILLFYTEKKDFLIPEEQNMLHGVAEALGIWLEGKRVSKALKASEKRYRSLFEGNMDAVLITDDEGRYVEANPAAVQLLGYSLKELKKKTVFDLTPIPEKPRGRELWKKFIQKKKQKGEYNILGKSGRSIPVDYVAVSNILPGLHVSFLRGQTEKKRSEAERAQLEKQFLQAQRLESIGRLGGGVAHDLNNLLTPILGYTEMLIMDTEMEASRRDSLKEVLNSANRARDLVRKLLAFSRRQTLSFRTIDVNRLVRQFEKLLRRTIRENIDIQILTADTLPAVRGDEAQLEQVIMNLVMNAQDAMPEGGELIIETSAVELDSAFSDQHDGVMPGAYVMITVTDTGEGMNMETQKMVFEPFFTTRGKARASGLGLSTVYGIVKQHNGSVWVYSEPGEGSTFKIYIPVRPDPGDEAQGSDPSDRDVSGSETVLLVEDSREVRELARSVLEGAGYHVLTAADGGEAVDISIRTEGTIHLLLTDVIMPGMDGKTLFGKLSSQRPSLRVLYMSGYSGNVVERKGILEKGVHFLQKPFTVKDLLQHVRDALKG